MSSDQYRKSHCGDKTILRPSYLHNGISYTGKMSSLYWIRALVTYVSIVRIPTPKRRCLRCKYSPWCCNSMINKIQHWKQALQWQWRTKHTFIPWMLKRYTVTQRPTYWLSTAHIGENVLPSILQYYARQIPQLKCFSYRHAPVFAQSAGDSC